MTAGDNKNQDMPKSYPGCFITIKKLVSLVLVRLVLVQRAGFLQIGAGRQVSQTMH